MKNAKRISIALFSLIIYAGFAMAQNPIIYPAKGQSNEKMEQDKFQCYGWAKESSGHDPMQAAPSSQQSNESGGVVRGGAKGAAGGAIIGAIAGDAGKGAAIGAASGAAVGGVRQRKRRNQQEPSWEPSTIRPAPCCREPKWWSPTSIWEDPGPSSAMMRLNILLLLLIDALLVGRNLTMLYSTFSMPLKKCT